MHKMYHNLSKYKCIKTVISQGIAKIRKVLEHFCFKFFQIILYYILEGLVGNENLTSSKPPDKAGVSLS